MKHVFPIPEATWEGVGVKARAQEGMDKSEKIVTGVFGLVLFVPLLLWSAFVLMKLWGWFLVPLGVPRIGLVGAVGVDLIVSLTAHQFVPERQTMQNWAERVARAVVIPAIILFVGWVAA